MLIGLCGGICAGKRLVAEYLVSNLEFQVLELAQSTTKASQLLDGPNLDGHPRVFSNVEDLLEFVTKHWRERFVTGNIWNQEILEALSKRPFFLLVNVDAPLYLRWERFQARCKENQVEVPLTLEGFVTKSDELLYNLENGYANVIRQADIHIVNSSRSRESLHSGLKKLDLLNEERLRPSWDSYFMQLASLAARRSNCMKRRVGCVLVREKRVISTGYNGTPRNIKNCNEGGCSRCNGAQGSGVGLSTCLCLHAEENALLEAGRERIREGSILYCDTCPCLTCSIKITQVGISEVVYSQGYSMDKETAAIFKEAGITLRQYLPPRKGGFIESLPDRTAA